MTAPGWRLSHHADLPSTSDALIRLADAGEPAGAAVLADRQTAGRGRAGRAWRSPVGNLHLSVLLRPGGVARSAPQWSLLAGVALAEASREAAPSAMLRLKWPNDLLRDGAKCAGVLVESGLDAHGMLAWLVLGFGVNLAQAPPLADRTTTVLGAADRPAVFADRLLRAIERWCAVQTVQGFAPVRAAWSRLGPCPGEALALRDGPAGHFAGLAEDGSLLLDTPGGRRRVSFGEIAA